MTDDRWARIDTLLQAALVRPPDARELFVEDACGDDSALRDEVLSLLAHATSADGFLEPTPSEAGKRLEPGEKLGPYTINEWIGAGGMGEVYRARDPRLDRDVAIKILPGAVSADPERLRRFEQEARAAAALNHPNIVTVHSVEQAESVHFLTMELVEGAPLSDRIPRDGLPLDRLLEIAVSLADAVGAAHARGIVHRDLKPANVMVTPEGRVKILDFGLAKLRPLADVGNLTTSPALTAEGRLLGTVAYMSPEQAEGREVDHRSDVFSLGVLLYELATGQRPFTGESSLSLLSSILKDTPRPIADLKPELPREVGRVIRRCLVKEPDHRYQSAKDLRNDLEEIKQELDSGALAAAMNGRTVASSRTRRRSIGLLAIVAVIVTAIVFGYLGWRGTSGRVPPRLTQTHLLPPSGVRIAGSGAQSILAIAPNGQWVAFQGASDDGNRAGIYLRSVAELEARFVLGSRGGSSPFFSPDSEWLAFDADGKMQKVRVVGGQPETICTCVPARMRGASWGDDGKIVFSVGSGLLRVPADGGQPTPLTEPAAGTSHYWPQILPGNQAAVFTLNQGGSDKWRKIAVVSLQTGNVQVLPSLAGTHPRYVPSGHLVYARLGTLYAAAFDARHPGAPGQPQAILEDVYFYGGSGYSAFDVASSGSLVYVPGAERLEEGELVWLDRQGLVVSAVGGRQPYLGPCPISPTGDRVAAVIRTTLEHRDLWIHDIGRGDWQRLTHDHDAAVPVWSRDGKWIVFTSFRSGHGKLYRVLSDGSRPPEALTTGVLWEFAGSFSVDGNLLFFMRNLGTAQWDLITLRLDQPGADPETFLATPVLEVNPAVSPNGRWVAYESFETGSRQIHVRPYPEREPRITISALGGATPQWSFDGRELFYRRPNEFWSVPVDAGATFRAGVPQRLFSVDWDENNVWGPKPGVSRDGRKFLSLRFSPRERTERLLVYAPDWLEQVRETVRR